MSQLIIVRGDLTEKPVTSRDFANAFEKFKTELEGVMYIGYPIIGTSNGGHQIDCLIILKNHGLFAINFIEGKEDIELYEEFQDDNFDKLNSKLFLHKDLTNKRKLGFDINTYTYAPLSSKEIDDSDNKLFNNIENLVNEIQSSSWDSHYYEILLSVIQSITSIRNSKARSYIKNPDSKGAKLKKLEDSIANLDRQQSRAVIETVEGVQRIRGLAGSGKTIILALKVAYLHVKNPDWKIAVTFNTRSLKEQFRRFITMFVYEHCNNEPDWSRIDIIHAWGEPLTEGIYYNLCRDHNINYYDFREARTKTNIYGKEFETICKLAISQISHYKEKYDLVVIDEAQDFSKEFLKICYNILKSPKRLVYAYDELQSLNKNSMESPEIIFGNDSATNKPLVQLVNEPNKPLSDVILYKCYRNSREILTAAHAIGFGIYRDPKKGLVQMFNNSKLWEDVGYTVQDGKLEDGENVTLSRTDDSSPEFLSKHSSVDDIISFNTFKNNIDQVNYVVEDIINHLQQEELRPDDIIVINPDPLSTKKLVGLFRSKLFDNGINSSLAGVSSSPDIFFENETITFTGIYRAKGNEAALVYIINAQDCYDGYELAKKRNILFTAMTRSKAWLRVCGYGNDMIMLTEEFNKVKENNFTLNFDYPTEAEREKMNIINRDMSQEELNSVKTSNKNLEEILKNLTSGKLLMEDIDKGILTQLRQILDGEERDS